MRVGRNEMCPCGSGTKFKNCCAGKTSRASSRGLIVLVAVIAVIAAIGVYPLVVKEKSDPAAISAGVPRPAGRPGATQPGPAPAGKVWSTEHGHWHDLPASQPISVQQQGGGAGQPATQIPIQPAAQTPAPQPPGAVPPGKVWSPEHGHWHDAPK